MKTRKQSKLSYLPLVMAGLMLCAALGVAGSPAQKAQAQEPSPTPPCIISDEVVEDGMYGAGITEFLTNEINPLVIPDGTKLAWYTQGSQMQIDQALTACSIGKIFNYYGLKYDVDPRLLVAMSYAESSFGNNLCYENQPGHPLLDEHHYNPLNYFEGGGDYWQRCNRTILNSWAEGIQKAAEVIAAQQLEYDDSYNTSGIFNTPRGIDSFAPQPGDLNCGGANCFCVSWCSHYNSLGSVYWAQGGDRFTMDLTYDPVYPPPDESEILWQGNTNYNCALYDSSRVMCWGPNTHGQLGRGDQPDPDLNHVLGLVGEVTSMAVGDNHACAVTKALSWDGQTYEIRTPIGCWGFNNHGQLGNETHTDSSRARQALFFWGDVDAQLPQKNIVDVAAGASHTCVLFDLNVWRIGGKVLCWGANNLGQLGLGRGASLSDVASPRLSLYVKDPTDITGPQEDLTGVVDIWAFGNTTCAKLNTGVMIGWGQDSDQCGITYVATGPAIQMEPAIAYNSRTQNYLVVWWEKGHTSSEDDGVYGRIVDPFGATVTEPFLISTEQNPGRTNSSERNSPQVTYAYDDDSDRFLVIWEELYDVGTGKYSLFSKVVSSEGVPIGDAERITDNVSEGFDWQSSIAYNSTDHNFLAIWKVGSTIHSRLLDAFGKVIGVENTNLYTPIIEDVHIVYSERQNVYLVAVKGSNPVHTRYTIEAFIVNSQGGYSGKKLVLHDQEDYPYALDLGYDSTNDRYLVVWQDRFLSSTVIGQILKYEGGVLSKVDDISLEDSKYPEVVFSPINGEFLVLTGDNSSPSPLWGRFVSIDGARRAPFEIASSWEQAEGAAHDSPDINPQRWMVVWNRMGDILARWISPASSGTKCPGLCTMGPAKTELWSDTERTNFSVSEGTVASTVEVEVLEGTTLIEQSAPGVPAGYQVSLRVPEWEAGGQTSGFLLPVTIHVSYSGLDLLHLDPSQLALYRWDETSSLWTLLPTTVDTASSQIMAQTTETGIFSLQAPPVCAGDLQEPNDSSTTASAISADSSPLNGFFDIPSDEDWYRLEALAGGRYLFETGNLSAGVDTRLDVYGPDGSTVLAADDNSGGGTASRLEWQAPSHAIYFLRVAQASGSANGCSATYELTATTQLMMDAGPDQTVDEGSQMTFGGLFYAAGGFAPAITWNFGDAETADGTLTPSHVYADEGTYTATLTVVYNGESNSDTLLVNVENVSPIVEAGLNQSAYREKQVVFEGSFTDPGELDTYTIAWDFGDGSTASGDLKPAHTYTDLGVYTVTLTITDDDGGVGVDTLTVTVDPLPNLALNQLATASGECFEDEGAASALDGGPYSKWCDNISTEKWLQVDLGAVYSLRQFVIHHAGDTEGGGEDPSLNTRDFTILVSTDEINWTTVVNVTGNTAGVTTHDIAAVSAQFVRLNIANPVQPGVEEKIARIYEFEVYGTPGPTSTPTPVETPTSTPTPTPTPTNTPEDGENLALNKPATASGYCNDPSASSAVDGDFYNKWCDNSTSAEKWLQVNLEGFYSLDQFVIRHAEAGGEYSDYNTRDFTIQVSTDGVDWTTVVDVTGNTAGVTTHDIAPTDARFVRLVITAAVQSGEDVARIYEFEVYGTGGTEPTATPTPGPGMVTIRVRMGSDPLPGAEVCAATGSDCTGYSGTTDADGQVTLTLPAGSYRFRADVSGIYYWSAAEDHCTLPECSSASILIAPPRGIAGDDYADIVIGQPDFGQITPNEVAANRVFNPGGVYVDRSVVPNRVYVYDAGNSRILGFNSLRTVEGGPYAGMPCTSDSDYPGWKCVIDPTRGADIVLGQSSFFTSACNGDSAYQNFPDLPLPSASTLCGMHPRSVSIMETGSIATMATDSQGNLYVTDFYNNRVLRYDNPFTHDTIADYVWGQANFSSGDCNRGASFGHPDSSSICLDPGPGNGNLKTGVAIDSEGNLWVADTQNNRVMRFPYDPALGAPAQEADLVLGQEDFTTVVYTSEDQEPPDNRMMYPASVRVDAAGVVYVADQVRGNERNVLDLPQADGRVLVFDPAASGGVLSSGMSATNVLWTGLGTPAEMGEPTGLELDASGALWVNDADSQRLLRFVDGVLERTMQVGMESGFYGGMGIDDDNNILITGWAPQQVAVYMAPEYDPDFWTAPKLLSGPYHLHNSVGAGGVSDPTGLEVTADQLIVADNWRILFWNDPADLTENDPGADGLIGAADFTTPPDERYAYGRMRADDQGHLWATRYDSYNQITEIVAFQLPLVSGAAPITALTMTSPLTLQGGGEFSWTWSLLMGGIDYQASCDCLWASDRDNNRAFRIRDVSTNPVVDIVLGQENLDGVRCNQATDLDPDPAPAANSLCSPGGLAFDRLGNLYLADNNLEFDGNGRLLEFDAAVLSDVPATATFNIEASRVFGRNGDFTSQACVPGDPMCHPWEPAFDSANRMVIGFNSYFGEHFPQIYTDPLTNPLPADALGDYYSHPYSIRFDPYDNLYVLDHTRNRVLIYQSGNTPATGTVLVTVADTEGTPQVGLSVYAFDGTTYTDVSGITDANGQVSFTLPAGSYRFRADKNRVEFWSGPTNHCTVPGCSTASIATTLPVTLTAHNGAYPDEGLTVYAFTGSTYTGYYGETDAQGRVTLTLPPGSYRFRVDKPGYQFWSGTEDHCTVPGCTSVDAATKDLVMVIVSDAGGNAEPGVLVRLYNGSTYVGPTTITNADGLVIYWLPEGAYRFQVEKNGNPFWSGETDHCVIRGCTTVNISTATSPVTITAQNGSYPDAGRTVWAMNGSTYTGYSGTTDAQGQVTLNLPPGSYRFRVDKPGQQFWSGPENHCTVPDCTSVTVATKDLVTVTVVDTAGNPEPGLRVRPYNGNTYIGPTPTTDAQGQVTFWMTAGAYRFAAEKAGVYYWSATSNHCSVPACSGVQITIRDPVTVTVTDPAGNPETGLLVRAYIGNAYAMQTLQTNAQGQAFFGIPPGEYRFAVEKDGVYYWSATSNHCSVPGCTAVQITIRPPVTLTVTDPTGNPEVGRLVRAYNLNTYAWATLTTNSQGQAFFGLPNGAYRFSVEKAGVYYWSGISNHCTVPDCTAVQIVTHGPVTVTVTDPAGNPQAGLYVRAYVGNTYAMQTLQTNAQGQAFFGSPAGAYRFAAESAGFNYWSGTTNHCTVPGCTAVSIIITAPVTVTVLDPDGVPIPNVYPRAFDGSTDTGYNARTNAQGMATLALPPGNYRFRVWTNNRYFWSGTVNHCSVPGCTSTGITVDRTVVVRVLDTNGNPDVGLTVHAYNGATSAGFTATTDSNGYAALSLPPGNYRFRAYKNGYAYWSGAVNHCTVPGCTLAIITTTDPVTVTVLDPDGVPVPNVYPRAFDGATDTGYNAMTNAQGVATFALPVGSYRFRVWTNNRYFWSGTVNHCSVPGCTSTGITVDRTVVVRVLDTNGNPDVGLTVHAYNGATSAGFTATTDSGGYAALSLPPGNYRFRAYKNGTAFWSGTVNHCTVPGCSTAGITTNVPTVVTVLDTTGQPQPDIWVHAFTGTTFANLSFKTNAQGQASFTLPNGSFHFRADRGDRAYWSGTENHCAVPGCTTASVTIYTAITVTVLDTNGQPDVGLWVRAFDGDTSTNYFTQTDAQGRAVVQVPNGSWRFRVGKNGTLFWSGTVNHCTVPGCSSASITTNLPVTVTVLDTTGQPQADIWVHAFDGTTFANLSFKTNAQGQASFTLPDGSFRFRADRGDRAYWSGTENHCSVPGCTIASVTMNTAITVTVVNTAGTPQAGLWVRAFDGDTSTNYFTQTDAQGRAVVQVPNGSWRFRVGKNNTLFWSGTANHCTVPSCTSATITINVDTVMTVVDTTGQPQAGILVHAFNGTTFANLSFATNAQGQASFTLPDGSYHFRADRGDRAYWSGTENHCSVPGCTTASVTMNTAITVTVLDTNGQPDVGLWVRAFDGDTSTNYFTQTDAQGRAVVQVPNGNWRFRVGKIGTLFWSRAVNHCTVPGCTSASIVTNVPTTVTVVNLDGQPEAGLYVYPFDGSTYTNLRGQTDAQGRASFALPNGSFRFRVDKLGREFWSGAANHCGIPGCTAVDATIPNAVVVTVLDTNGNPEAGVDVWAYNGDIFSGNAAVTDAEGHATILVPAGSYRFKTAKNGSTFWSGTANHCTVPGCSTASITTNVPTVVTVVNLDGQPAAGLYVYPFDGSTWSNRSGMTDAQGRVSFTLPSGNYRFRIDKLGREFWSGAANHCGIPGCTAVDATIPNAVVVTVLDTNGNPEAGVDVWAYNGDIFSGNAAVTDAEGHATILVPAGSYRFKTAKNGSTFWSGMANHCTVPGCSTASITTTVPMTVTVVDLSGQPAAGIPVYVFDGATWIERSGLTNAQGQITFTLPQGSYRFRAYKGVHEFWSGAENHCAIPGCTEASITVNNSVVVTVLNTDGDPEPGLEVKLYNGTTFAGSWAITDAQGQVTLDVPAGTFRFRALKNGTPFWSGETNHCTVPGCTSASITTTALALLTVPHAGDPPRADLEVYIPMFRLSLDKKSSFAPG